MSRHNKRSNWKAGPKRATRELRSVSRAPQLLTLTLRQKATRERALELLWELRHGGSYSKLLRKHRLNARTARKYLGRNLLGGTPGTPVRASKSDRLVRERPFPRAFGDVPRLIRGSKAATTLSNFLNDRGKLLDHKMSPAEFETKWGGVFIQGEEVFADAAEIFRMANAGHLRIDDFYSPPGAAE